MYLFHGAASILHGIQCFLIDVRGFYAIDLLFDLCNLRGGLLQATFVGLFPPQGSFRSYHPGLASKINARGRWDLQYAILVGQATAEGGTIIGRSWEHTDLIRCDVFPRHGILLCHLCL